MSSSRARIEGSKQRDQTRWNESLLDILGQFAYQTVGGEPEECCCMAMSEAINVTHFMTCKAWRPSLQPHQLRGDGRAGRRQDSLNNQ